MIESLLMATIRDCLATNQFNPVGSEANATVARPAFTHCPVRWIGFVRGGKNCNGSPPKLGPDSTLSGFGDDSARARGSCTHKVMGSVDLFGSRVAARCRRVDDLATFRARAP